MQFRRSGPSDQRRRRVLLEENRAQAARAAAPSTPRGTGGAAGRVQRSYSEEALAEHQPPITALIPRRRVTLTVLLLALLAAIAGLLAAYGHLRLRPAALWPGPLAALDLESPGSLAAWFSSLVLLAAAAMGVQIYRLRRHRVDDYRGRYRVWIWMPMVLALMAAGAATPIVADTTALIGHYAGLESSPALKYLQMTALAAIWTLIGLRLAFEMRRSPTAILFLILSAACYFGVAATRVQTLPPMAELLRTLAASGALLLGHVAVLFAVAVYGRYVYRDSQGIIAAEARNRKKKAARPARRQKEEPAQAAEEPEQKGETPAEEEQKPTARQPAATAKPVAETKPASETKPEAKTVAESKPEKKTEPPRPVATPAPAKPKPAAQTPTLPNLSPNPPSPAPAKPKAVTPPPPLEPEDEEEDEAEILSGQFGEDDHDQNLSRAERRRLRKLQRRDQRKAA